MDTPEINTSNPEILLPQEIQTQLKTLQSFEPRIEQHTSAQVNKAWEISRELIEPYKKFFIDHNIVLAVHGSMQYHDPKNLDVDIELIKSTSLTSEESDIFLEVENQFRRLNYWPNDTNECEPNLGEIDLEEFAQDIKTGEDEEYGIHPELNGSLLLTSVVFYPEQAELFQQMRSQAINILLQNPQSFKKVTEVLDETIAIRKERRNIP